MALGWSLARRGHDVTVAAPTNVSELVTRSGLAYAPLPVDVQALFAHENAQRMLAKGHIHAFFDWLSNEERAYNDALRAALKNASAQADALVVHPLVEDRAAAVGAARSIPVVPLYFFPMPASRCFASPSSPSGTSARSTASRTSSSCGCSGSSRVTTGHVPA